MASTTGSDTFHSVYSAPIAPTAADAADAAHNSDSTDFAPLSPHGPLPPSLSAGNRLSLSQAHQSHQPYALPDFTASPYSSPPHSPRHSLPFAPFAALPGRASAGGHHQPSAEAYDPPLLSPTHLPYPPSHSASHASTPSRTSSSSRDPSPTRSTAKSGDNATYPPPVPPIPASHQAGSASPLRSSWTAALGKGRYSLARTGGGDGDGGEARKGLLTRDEAALGLEWNRGRGARQRRYLAGKSSWTSHLLSSCGAMLNQMFGCCTRATNSRGCLARGDSGRHRPWRRLRLSSQGHQPDRELLKSAAGTSANAILSGTLTMGHDRPQEDRKAAATASSASSVASASYASYMSSYYASLSSAESASEASVSATASTASTTASTSATTSAATTSAATTTASTTAGSSITSAAANSSSA